MRSWRLLAASVLIDDVAVDVAYADVFVVHRDGEGGPGPNDWEATITTSARQRLAPGAYTLVVRTVDDHQLTGRAVLRFSDGERHLFRGDGDLAGVAAAIT